MFFEASKSLMYSDTLVPDIFITEYLPSLDSHCVKIYLYCLFLGKHQKQATPEELSKKLGMDILVVKDSLLCMESLGILTRKENTIVFMDLKEKEINKIYRLKVSSTPEEAIYSTERNKKRNQIISAINNQFFHGVMSPSWYTDIDAWFDRYKFDEDVMYVLFQHCYDHKGLSKNYILKVADNWHSKKITTAFDLDNYYMEYQKVKDIKLKIVKKLKLSRYLSEYEEEFIEKWVVDYKYDFEIIEMALKKTTGKTNPSFNYIHSILEDWHKNGLSSKDAIIQYEVSRKGKTTKNKATAPAVPQQGNFEQRKYDDDFYDKLYENV